MIDLSDLNYKQLIELEKQIQKEKAKKVHDHLTKGDLINSDKAHEILVFLDPEFQDAKYGYPNEEWKTIKPDVEYFESQSPEVQKHLRTSWERPEVTRSVSAKIDNSIVYLCDIAFKNYKDYIPRTMCGPNRNQPKTKYSMIKLNTEIPWQKADQYKSMYNELCDVFLKYAKGDSNV